MLYDHGALRFRDVTFLTRLHAPLSPRASQVATFRSFFVFYLLPTPDAPTPRCYRAERTLVPIGTARVHPLHRRFSVHQGIYARATRTPLFYRWKINNQSFFHITQLKGINNILFFNAASQYNISLYLIKNKLETIPYHILSYPLFKIPHNVEKKKSIQCNLVEIRTILAFN